MNKVKHKIATKFILSTFALFSQKFTVLFSSFQFNSSNFALSSSFRCVIVELQILTENTKIKRFQFSLLHDRVTLCRPVAHSVRHATHRWVEKEKTEREREGKNISLCGAFKFLFYFGISIITILLTTTNRNENSWKASKTPSISPFSFPSSQLAGQTNHWTYNITRKWVKSAIFFLLLYFISFFLASWMRTTWKLWENFGCDVEWEQRLSIK